MRNEIVVERTENLEGDLIVTESCFVQGELLIHRTLNCYSSNDYGFGTCLCQNHNTWEDEIISRKEWLELSWRVGHSFMMLMTIPATWFSLRQANL